MPTSTPSPLPTILLLSLTWVYTVFGSDPNCKPTDRGSILSVMHVYAPCSPFRSLKPPSWEEQIFDMDSKDKARLIYLANLAKTTKTALPLASGRQILQSATYIVRTNFGTPAQPLLLGLDTGNDAAWIPCNGCVGCSPTVFDSTKSTTYMNLGCGAAQCRQVPNPSCTGGVCSFNQTYGAASLQANLTQDTLTLATDVIPSYFFGCLQHVTGTSIPPQGLLGLARGPLSLLAQTQNLYKSTFSYCLPTFTSRNFTGSIRLGPVGQPIRIKTTPLLTNPKRPLLYYVNLIGIRVGRRVVNIPPSALAFDPVTGAGTIIDSGTVFTRLVEPAYVAVRDEFRKRINGTVSSLGGFDTCYMVPIVAPTITFQFTGMNVTLPPDNFLIHSTAGSTTCLAMAAAPNNVNSVVNVIATMQQQNHRVLFDLPNSRIGVAREFCT